MKSYLSFIAKFQGALVIVGLLILMVLPPLIAYTPLGFDQAFQGFWYEVSLFAAFLVLAVRPLADLLDDFPFVRPLVILRKGMGIVSASVIVSFMLAHIMQDGWTYLAHFLEPSAWSLAGYKVLAPLGDLSALVLLVTSNQYSKRILGKNWKRVQKLAYVYFYAGALYEYLLLGNQAALWYILFVAGITAAAFVVKRLPAPTYA